MQSAKLKRRWPRSSANRHRTLTRKTGAGWLRSVCMRCMSLTHHWVEVRSRLKDFLGFYVKRVIKTMTRFCPAVLLALSLCAWAFAGPPLIRYYVQLIRGIDD